MQSVSVVIPTFNRARLISETVEAILDQSQPASEVIIVDDGSTDDTLSLLRGYGRQVRSISIENSGDLVARNVGLAAATSDLVAFCDSDDLWKPDFLRVMSALWEAEPALVAAYANFVIVRNGVWETLTKFEQAPAGFWGEGTSALDQAVIFRQPAVKQLIGFQPFFPSAMMVNRGKFIALGGWDESVSRQIGCDLATALRVVQNPPFAASFEVLVGIRKHAHNISADVQAMNLGDANILDHLIRTNPKFIEFRTDFQASSTRRRQMALDTAFSRGDFPGVLEISRVLADQPATFTRRLKVYTAALPLPLAKSIAAILGTLSTFVRSVTGSFLPKLRAIFGGERRA